MGYSFRPGLHVCAVGDDLVFLDVPADRYFALTGPINDACQRVIAGSQPTAGDVAIMDRLISRDVIRPAQNGDRLGLCPGAPPISTTQIEAAVQPKWNLIAAAFSKFGYALVEAKVRPLERILDSVARLKLHRKASHARQHEPVEWMLAFAAVDRSVSSYGRCLPRSVALARALISTGSEPELVIGVKLRPFEAHCWVQVGHQLVSDDPGTIAPFTPILII